LSFNGGQSLNIFELDAASNNSVEDIRNLVDQVRFAPASGKYKIYIIDEVHMLSNAAFNAFLKTLEEPPSYAIFILATTEKHKIIPTILSRCQIFDFNRIQVDDIAGHLSYVAGKEGITADPDALHIIAQKADGALRDSLSIFDQIVSFAGNNLTYKDVINNLSILDYDYYFRITDDLRAGNIPNVLLTFNELLSDGFDGHSFINGLAGHFRDLLVCQDQATVSLLEVSKNIKEKYYHQAKQTSPQLLLRLLDICNRCDLDYRAAKNQRLHVELALIRMCTAGNPMPAEEKKNSELNQAPAPIQTPAAVVSQPVAAPAQPITPTPPAASVSASMAEEPAQQSPKPMMPNLKAMEPAVAAPKPAPVNPPSTPATSNASGIPKTGGFMKNISLSSANQPKAQEVDDAPKNIENMPTDAVTDEAIQKVWMEYAEMQNQQGNRQMFTTLTMNKPTMKGEFDIELIIHNQAQENLMQEEKTHLMDHLRRQLNNYKLQLTTVIVSLTDESDVAYTNKERYVKMVQKNPDLDDFRKSLGLELEL
jgi:DNA polymerase-3 subunit gamma/tau